MTGYSMDQFLKKKKRLKVSSLVEEYERNAQENNSGPDLAMR